MQNRPNPDPSAACGQHGRDTYGGYRYHLDGMAARTHICNTLCPVGTILGCVSRNSAMRIDIDTDRCIQCRRCEHVCKAECIDMQSHVVDMSRCVVCFDCLPCAPTTP